jgi:hypothetical protein
MRDSEGDIIILKALSGRGNDLPYSTLSSTSSVLLLYVLRHSDHVRSLPDHIAPFPTPCTLPPAPSPTRSYISSKDSLCNESLQGNSSYNTAEGPSHGLSPTKITETESG